MKRKGFIPCCQRGDYNIGRFKVKLFQMLYNMVEPVCCKKQQKKDPDQLLVCGIWDL